MWLLLYKFIYFVDGSLPPQVNFTNISTATEFKESRIIGIEWINNADVDYYEFNCLDNMCNSLTVNRSNNIVFIVIFTYSNVTAELNLLGLCKNNYSVNFTIPLKIPNPIVTTVSLFRITNYSSTSSTKAMADMARNS